MGNLEMLKKKYYLVPLSDINKSLLKKGQKIYLHDDMPALCVKLHPQILPYLGTVGKFKETGANWIDAVFDGKTILVCDAYASVMFAYDPIKSAQDGVQDE